MKSHQRLALLIVVFGIYLNPAFATEVAHQNPQTDTSRLQSIESNLQRNADDIAIIRRDEINYSIEKNLLEKQYSATLLMISTITGLAFGIAGLIFGLLGYSNFRSAKELNAEYTKQLNEANGIKSTLEANLTLLKGTAEVLEEEFNKKLLVLEVEIANIQNTQNKKIQLLEVAEKAAQHMARGDYSWAEEILKAGVEIDPSFLPLRHLYAICKSKSGKFNDALKEFQWLMENEKDESQKEILLGNLAEALIFAKKIQEFEKLYLENMATISKLYDGKVKIYLETIKEIGNGNLASATSVFRPYFEQIPVGQASKQMGTWGFVELEMWLKALPDSESKVFGQLLVQFLDGRLHKDHLAKYFEQSVATQETF